MHSVTSAVPNTHGPTLSTNTGYFSTRGSTENAENTRKPTALHIIASRRKLQGKSLRTHLECMLNHLEFMTPHACLNKAGFTLDDFALETELARREVGRV